VKLVLSVKKKKPVHKRVVLLTVMEHAIIKKNRDCIQLRPSWYPASISIDHITVSEHPKSKTEQIRAFDFGLAHRDLPAGSLYGILVCPRSFYVTSIHVTLTPADALLMLKL